MDSDLSWAEQCGERNSVTGLAIFESSWQQIRLQK